MSERAFVSVTVRLELEWVMRGFYALPPAEIARVMMALTGIEHITIDDRAAVLTALDAFQKGMDFAAALHLAQSGRSTAFATFDRRLATRAQEVGMAPPAELLG
jgi:predicted nucleic-acid-binding protein